MVTALGIAIEVISLYILIIVVGVILSWLFAFNVINRHNDLVATTASFIHRITEPALAPIRRRMPRMGTRSIANRSDPDIVLYTRRVARGNSAIGKTNGILAAALGCDPVNIALHENHLTSHCDCGD